jgi:hypothetical protein
MFKRKNKRGGGAVETEKWKKAKEEKEKLKEKYGQMGQVKKNILSENIEWYGFQGRMWTLGR